MNSVILSGFMWQKKFFDGGTPRLNFNLGLNVGKDKEGKPIWENISCVVWGERARSMEKYFNDGDACEVQGKLRSRMVEDKTGLKTKATNVQVDSFSWPPAKRNTPAKATAAPSDEDLAAYDDEIPF